MLTKTALLELDAETRTFALVGAFIGYFALLEQGIESALGEVVGVDGVRRAIIGRNMGFDDKIKTLRTLVDLFITDKVEAKRFDDLAKRARKCGELRNIVAHTPFRQSSTSDGAEFFPISASSKLEFPDMDWSIDDFLMQIDSINQIDNDLRSLEKRMSLQRIAEALMQVPDANDARGERAAAVGGLFGLGSALLKDNDP
ncbi:hypothetical protein [Aminobacter sp. AP02]|uniref:hypothetical protein n=1 Tax=Aminobacter sp. AP02 TaxID=2135737 RepID=UPI000D6C8EE3|nr:hypothetical protein [Aminobacter sp. AP02]PWK65895.1 hypothetical protein C8K44_115110 [Aminobacter sp. AP02]